MQQLSITIIISITILLIVSILLLKIKNKIELHKNKCDQQIIDLNIKYQAIQKENLIVTSNFRKAEIEFSKLIQENFELKNYLNQKTEIINTIESECKTREIEITNQYNISHTTHKYSDHEKDDILTKNIIIDTIQTTIDELQPEATKKEYYKITNELAKHKNNSILLKNKLRTAEYNNNTLVKENQSLNRILLITKLIYLLTKSSNLQALNFQEKSKHTASTLSKKHQITENDELNKISQILSQKIDDLEKFNSEINAKILTLENLISTQKSIEVLEQKLSTLENEHEIFSAGLYPLSLDFGTPDELKQKLEDIRKELVVMTQSNKAVICTKKWTIDGSAAEGSKATRHYIRIMLRTFNADADACLDLVRWNNLEKCIARLQSSFQYVNELGSTHATQIQLPYLDARIRQLHLMHKYKESVYQNKESMRAARQRAIEENRSIREIKRVRVEAEIEEKRYTSAIEKAKSEISALIGAEKEQMQLTISNLERKLQETSLLKQRAISMAQITKAGFVYIASNIGSFGSDVLKIGMTRRIDPHERIRELGGASVPFHFDVHAMIYSDNAPELENLFHRQFTKQRINLANGRKEFFRIPLENVVNFAKNLNLETEFSLEPEAKDFNISSKIRQSILSSLSDEELNAKLYSTEEIKNNSFNDDDDD